MQILHSLDTVHFLTDSQLWNDLSSTLPASILSLKNDVQPSQIQAIGKALAIQWKSLDASSESSPIGLEVQNGTLTLLADQWIARERHNLASQKKRT